MSINAVANSGFVPFNKELTKPLTDVEKILDYTPILSSIANLRNIAAIAKRAIFRGDVSVENIQRDYDRIDTKGLWRCFLLLIPILGNVIVALYDRKYDNEERMLEEVAQDPSILRYASKRLLNSSTFMLKAIKATEDCEESVTPYMGEILRKSPGFILAAFKEDESAIDYADKALFKHYGFMVALAKINPVVIKWADPSLMQNPNFIVEISKSPHCTMEYSSNGSKLVYVDPEDQERYEFPLPPPPVAS